MSNHLSIQIQVYPRTSLWAGIPFSIELIWNKFLSSVTKWILTNIKVEYNVFLAPFHKQA